MAWFQARSCDCASCSSFIWTVDSSSPSLSSSVPPGDGGVLPEYRKKGLEPRAVTKLRPSPFFGKEVNVLGVPVKAHADVSDAALLVAADRLSRMLRNLPDAVHERLTKRGAAFHIIGIVRARARARPWYMNIFRMPHASIGSWY